MAVTIRLRRMGKINQSFFRVVAADSRTSTKGRFLESLGWYDPKKKTDNYKLDLERIDYWIGTGAKPSDTVRHLLNRARRDAEKSADKPQPEEAKAAEPKESDNASTQQDEPKEAVQETKEPASEEETPAAEKSAQKANE